MSSNLVSYSSGEDDDDKGVRHADANYDDVGMEMSDEEGPLPSEAAMFSSKEEFKAYQKQFVSSGSKSEKQRDNPGNRNEDATTTEYGSHSSDHASQSKRSTSRESDVKSRDLSHSNDYVEEKSARYESKEKHRRDSNDSRQKRRHKDHHRHRSRSRSRDRDRTHHRRRSRSRDRSDRHRDRRPKDDDRRYRRHNADQERQDLRSRKLQSLGLIGKKDETFESHMEKVKEMTGVEVPKYYNPAAINPLRYAEQIKKRQMLWSKKPATSSGAAHNSEENETQVATTAEEIAETRRATSTAYSAANSLLGDNSNSKPSSATSFNKWEATNFGNDKTNEKFRRLMGIKGGNTSAPVTASTTSSSCSSANQDTSKWFADQEQQYERARAITHTQRGLGLGFTSALPANPGVAAPVAPAATAQPSSTALPPPPTLPANDKRPVSFTRK